MFVCNRFLSTFVMAALSFTCISGTARSEPPAIFDANQFGNTDLVPRQAAGAMESLIESLGAQWERFEPVSRFNEDDPFRALGKGIGRMQMLVREASGLEHTLLCTVALIDLDRIITNAHCIPGSSGTVQRAKVWFGYVQLGGKGSEVYDVSVTPLETDSKLDFSILRVLGEPGRKFPPVNRALRAARDNESLYILHHPGGQPQKLTRAFCRAFPSEAQHATEVRHQCDTLPGSSGSIIFALSDGAIVGLHHTGGLTPADEMSFNRGTDALALKAASPVVTELFWSTNPTPKPAQPPPQRAAPNDKPVAIQPVDNPAEIHTAALPRIFNDYSGWGMDGNDIRRLDDVQQADCRAACDTESKCAAFTYDRWNYVCYLKSSLSALISSPQYFSATAADKQVSFDSSPMQMRKYRKKIFNEPGYWSGSVKDFDACLKRCLGDDRCKASTFMKRENLCKLLEMPNSYVSDAEADSAVKSQYK